MDQNTLPLIIVGGSDGRAGELPPDAGDLHALAGYKAARLRIGDRPLVQHVIERMQATGRFDPIFLAGPERVYRSVGVTIPILDTDSSFGNNIRAGIEGARRVVPQGPLAMITCDILPDRGEIDAVMEAYRRSSPCDFFFPLVRVPKQDDTLGASGWKPRYRIPPEPGAEPVAILPSHICIFQPEAHRLRFMYRLIDTGYATRNKSIAARRYTMVRRAATAILLEEGRALVRGQLPLLSYAAWRHGLGTARKLAAGSAALADVEESLEWLFLDPVHRKQKAGKAVRMPIVDAVSLAQDIDTEEEAAEKGATQLSESASEEKSPEG